MNDFRNRMLIPALIPLGAAAVIAIVAVNFSRILISTGGSIAVVVGIGSAAGVLFGATYLTTRTRFFSMGVVSTLTGLALTLVLGGMIALAFENEEKSEHGEKAHTVEEFDSEIAVTAFDIGFREKQIATPAGKVQINYANQGARHTLVIQDVPGIKLEVGKPGDKDSGVVELAAGAYTFYCDVPGHRSAGMEGILTAQ